MLTTRAAQPAWALLIIHSRPADWSTAWRGRKDFRRANGESMGDATYVVMADNDNESMKLWAILSRVAIKHFLLPNSQMFGLPHIQQERSRSSRPFRNICSYIIDSPELSRCVCYGICFQPTIRCWGRSFATPPIFNVKLYLTIGEITSFLLHCTWGGEQPSPGS